MVPWRAGLIPFAVVVLMTFSSQAAGFVVTCSDLKGYRTHFGIEDMLGRPHPPSRKEEMDTIGGAEFNYVFNDLNGSSLYFVVSSTKNKLSAEQVQKMAPARGKKLPIMKWGTDQIVAFEFRDQGLWVHSLYIGLKQLILTRQTHRKGGEDAVGPSQATGAVFSAPCRIRSANTKEY